MKKLFSLLLSLIMVIGVFTSLPISVSAVEGEEQEILVDSISFNAVEPVVCVENLTGAMRQEQVWNEETQSYDTLEFFAYAVDVAGAGNTVTVNYTDGTSDVFTYTDTYWSQEGEQISGGWFNEADEKIELEVVDDQSYENQWGVGEYFVKVCYMGAEVLVPVTVKKALADVKNFFTVKTSGFKGDKITYTVYLNPNVQFYGSVIYAKFNRDILEVDTDIYATGEYWVDDGDGGERANVIGEYQYGYMAGYEDQYSIGYVYGKEQDTVTKANKKAFVQFTFNSVSGEPVDTMVDFYCYEFGSYTNPENNIPNGSAELISSMSTLHDHIPGDWIIKTNPTCTAKGSKYKICTDCEEVLQTEEIPAKGHQESSEAIYTPATCTKNGSEVKKCSVCGVVLKSKVIPATGHTASAWITDKKPTVNAKGSKHNECVICGVTISRQSVAQLKCAKPKLKKIENTTSGVKITWGKVSGADSYAVYRKVKGGSYSKIATTKKTSYTDKKAKSGKTYYYVIKAVNEAGASASSNSKSVKYLADPTLKTPKSTKKGVSLKWTKVTGASGYIIYRKTGSGSYKKLKTEKGVKNLSYVDKSAKKGKKYTYKVKAYSGKTYSAYSNAKKIKDKY